MPLLRLLLMTAAAVAPTVLAPAAAAAAAAAPGSPSGSRSATPRGISAQLPTATATRPGVPRWVAPLDGPLAVVRPFDPPSNPWGSGHRGVDLRSAPGAVVRAAGTGRVTFAAVLAGRGVVVLSHGTLRTTYEPVAAAVPVGAAVAVGTVVGRLTVDGSHCAPSACLHWELLRAANYLDPLTLLRSRGVRLLPLPRGEAPSARPEPVAQTAVAHARALQIPSYADGGHAPIRSRVITATGAVTTGLGSAAVVLWRRRRPP